MGYVVFGPSVGYGYLSLFRVVACKLLLVMVKKVEKMRLNSGFLYWKKEKEGYRHDRLQG